MYYLKSDILFFTGYNKNMNTRKPATQTSRNLKSSSTISKPTPGIEEGPYYKADSPERTKLYEEGIPGAKLTLTGSVLDMKGKPIVHAWLDFWQANGRGEYDNSGYILRGHQYTDKSGKFHLETVVPGAYAVRTPHIHVKVRANDSSPILTTQLFVPGMASNKADFLYRDDLLMEMKDTPNGKTATFNFILKVQPGSR
jgi:protocatechuate 3,4-dioxygenase beta subunit